MDLLDRALSVVLATIRPSRLYEMDKWMDVGAIKVSVDALVAFGVIALYAPVIIFSYQYLIPRLSPSARNHANVMLSAQILVVFAALFFQPSSNYEGWLFQLHKEGNISSTLASMQLALVGGVALFTARLAKAKPTWHRLYFGGTGLTFLILALDEFTMLHEIHLGVYFIWLGAGLVAATIAVALRSPARAWIWHLSLLTGLAISVAGAYGLELVRPICGSLSILRLDKCLYFFYWEECLEFLGIWLALVALLGHYSDTMPTPSRLTRGLLYCVPLLWVIVLAALALAPRLEARFFAEPAAVDFVSDVRLIGYRTERSAESLNVRLYTSTRQERYDGLGFSIQLIDQADEVSIAGQNEYGGRRYGFWLFGPDDVPVFLKYLQVPIPPDAPAQPRALGRAHALEKARR